MNLEKVSDGLLKAIHEGCERAYENDRSLTPNQKKRAQAFGSDLSYYGVDEYPDWPDHIRAIECQMKKRKLPFDHIQI